MLYKISILKNSTTLTLLAIGEGGGGGGGGGAHCAHRRLFYLL